MKMLVYVRPKAGYGIESIRERDGTDTKFDLKHYVEITNDRLEYSITSGVLARRPDKETQLSVFVEPVEGEPRSECAALDTRGATAVCLSPRGASGSRAAGRSA
jgi:hypothetical protein